MSMRSWIKQLFSQQGFRGPVLTLLSGTTVVMAIAYFSQFILTRLYLPDEFGVADYFVSLMVVLISFTSLRYEDALMLPEDDKEAAEIFWLALFILLFFTGLISLVLLWRKEIALLLGLPAIAPWLLLVPPTLLAMRTAKLAEIWLLRDKRFRHISASQIANTLTMVSARVGAGLPPLSAGSGGLIGGFMAGHVVSMVVLGWFLLQKRLSMLVKAFDWIRICQAAQRYRRFALFSTPSTLLNAVVSRLPFLLLPFYFDASVLGLFGRAFNVLAIPLSLIGGAIAQVFFVQAAEALRDARLSEITQTVHQRLVMLGLFPTLALVLAGPDVFEVAFGPPWREAGVFVQYVGPWLFLAAVASPLTRLFDVLERQRLDFFTSLLMFTALTLALLIGGNSGSIRTTLLLIGGAGVLVRVIHLGVLLRLAHITPGMTIRAYGRYLLFSLPGLLLIGLTLQLASPWLTTVATIVAGILYGILILWKDRLLATRP